MKKIITLFTLFFSLSNAVSYAQLTLNSLENQTIFKTPNANNAPLSMPESNAFFSNKKSKIGDLLAPSDTFHAKRFWTLVGTGTGLYVGSIALLNNLWYADYPRGKFHLFNDQGEWMQMDKLGHTISAYQASKWVYGAMRWSGMKNKNAAWFGMAVGTSFQATIEILDGFSDAWGFSWADITANTAGCALFGLQQAVWDEQRILIKVSNTPLKYPQNTVRSIDGSKTTTTRIRAQELYGDNYTQTFFKDYNALIFWLSVNPKSFHKGSRLPDWLNVAVGYSAENMYGGYKNEWPAEAPEFRLSDTDFPRYRQFYLSLDIDLSRIKTKSKFIKTLARTFNFVKIPAPAIEFNTLGKVKFHPIIF